MSRDNVYAPLPKGYKRTEVGVIPEDWEVKRLGEIGRGIIGLTYSPEDVSDDGIFVLRASNIGENSLLFDDSVFVKTTIPDNLFVRENDLLICVRNGSRNLIGKCALIGQDIRMMTFGAFMTVFRSLSNSFIFRCFQSDIVKRQIHAHLGATINQITNKSLTSFQIPFPPLPEQRAIAEVLSDVDALLAALDKLIAKKRAVKAAAMQDLLTGRVRLPGFSGEWTKTLLGSVTHIIKGVQVNRDTLLPNGSFPVWNGGREPSGYIEQWNANAFTITISEGGNSCGFVNYVERKFWLGGHCYAISPCSTLDQKYLYHYLKFWETDIMALRVGSGLPNIQRERLANYLVVYPEMEEQRAIAAVLSEMDAEIAALERQRAKVTAIKQGMMQELLTGRIRLVKL